MDDRAEFEQKFDAWVKSGAGDKYPHQYGSTFTAGAWMAWACQQERIAELEADIAHKDAYAEQLGRLLFKAGAERQELEAQVQALSLDAGRLDWLTFHLSGKALRDIGVIWSEHADARAAIDAAIAAGKGEVNG